jgi:hypothetical protein
MTTKDILFLVHITSLGFAMVGILYADRLAFAWLRGVRNTLPQRHLLRAHHAVSFALAALIGSGLLLFWPLRNYLLHTSAFWVKMSFVAVLLINSFVIERLMHTATHRPFKELSLAERAPLFVSGAVSVVCWVGAGTTAFFLFG